MTLSGKTIKILLTALPVLWVGWGLIVNHLSGPHYLSRSDPEYVYLLNGLNAALVQFDRIGHVDHPGTPFQLVTGFFIALIYAVSGSGSMVEDVITSPEKYLFLSSFLLSLVTAGLLFRISSLEYRRNRSLTGALLIPATLLFYAVVTDLPSRYIPDRFLVVIILGFISLSINYLQSGCSRKRFILYSALLMALGVVTKINFLPFLALPLFFIDGWKGKLTYAGYLVLFAVVLFLPVHKKFEAFWQFAVQVSTHDGLYGGGTEKMVDMDSLFRNLTRIIAENPAFAATWLLSVIAMAVLFASPSARAGERRTMSLLAGFILVSVMLVFIVAKHYKNYYMIPALVYSGFALYILRDVAQGRGYLRYFDILLIPAGILFIALTWRMLIPGYGARMERKVQEKQAQTAIEQIVGPDAYFLVEPTWMAGPTPVNGLVYGISYVVHRHYFFNAYEEVYPNVLTYEGKDRPLRYFRMIDASNESILKSGKDLFLLDSPGRTAASIIHYLDSCAAVAGIRIRTDTVYTHPEIRYHLLRISNSGGWRTVHDARFGFEKRRHDDILSEDGLKTLHGPFSRIRQSAGSGMYALELSSDHMQTPEYSLKGVVEGDRLEVSIKRRKGPSAERGELVATYSAPGGERMMHAVSDRVSSVDPAWELVRLALNIEEQPADSTLTCFYRYQGVGEQVVDDLRVRHFSTRESILHEKTH